MDYSVYYIKLNTIKGLPNNLEYKQDLQKYKVEQSIQEMIEHI